MYLFQVHSGLNRYMLPFRDRLKELVARYQSPCHWQQAIPQWGYETRTQVLARFAHFQNDLCPKRRSAKVITDL